MKVAVVILNWNGEKLLEKFLPSVVLYSSEVANIYVADNASTDGSISFLKKQYPEIKIIQNTENGGYAKGYNQAFKSLYEDVVVLLNSDVEVTENWLAPFISLFTHDDFAGAAQPKILDYNKKTHFEYAGAAGGFIDKYGYPFCRGRIFDAIEEDKNQYHDVTEVFWASGACLAVKRKDFLSIGGFDEDFFAHQEEIDLCWRLKANGRKILYLGNTHVFHVGGATLGAANPQKTFYNFRNSLLALLKNVKGLQIWYIIFIRLILDGAAAMKFIIEGKPQHFFAILRAHYSFYSLIPKFLKKRKYVSSNTKYFKIKSIVYQHFILKIKIFGNLQ